VAHAPRHHQQRDPGRGRGSLLIGPKRTSRLSEFSGQAEILSFPLSTGDLHETWGMAARKARVGRPTRAKRLQQDAYPEHAELTTADAVVK
jgi:hypothetical protein